LRHQQGAHNKKGVEKMKKAIKNHIIAACEAKNLPAYWVELVLEIYDAQMTAAKKHSSAKIIATIASVSASGMSRKIKFGFVRKTGEFVDITRIFAELYGAKVRSSYSGFQVNGCGMDMIFHVLDSIFYTITPKSERSKYNFFCRYEQF
jgi:hypothetical protein